MRTPKPAAAALGVALALTSQAAHATETTAPVQVRIYLANDHRSPAVVNTTCDENGPHVHTVLYNDHTGNTGSETVKIYREDGGVANIANWPAVAGPFTIPLNSSTNVTLPYGPDYDAVAVVTGSTFPANLGGSAFAAMVANNTADNSQLFAPGTAGQSNYEYPVAPAACLPKPTPTPTVTTTSPSPCSTPNLPPVKIPDVATTPTCAPTSTNATPTPTGDPTGTPTTTSPVTTTATTTTTAVTTTVTVPATTTTGTVTSVPTASTTPSGPTLAHTGSSALPFGIAGGMLAILGAGLVLYSYQKKSGSRLH